MTAAIVRVRPPSATVIALVLSLVLNLFAVGGYFYSRWAVAPRHVTPPEQAIAMLAERLELRPGQQASFQEFVAGLRREQIDLTQQNQPLTRDAWEELRKDPPDAQRVQQLLDEMAMHRHAFQMDTAALLVRFVSALTPEQRDKLARAALDHHDPAGGPVRAHVGN